MKGPFAKVVTCPFALNKFSHSLEFSQWFFEVDKAHTHLQQFKFHKNL